MSTLGSRVVGLVACALVAALLSGCSVIAEPPPASAGELRPGRGGRRCGRSLWYPVFDSLSAVAGATWVLRANSELDDAEPHPITQTGSGGYQYTVQVPGSGADTSALRAERIAGWTVVGAFGASAIYGYIVEGRCAALRRRPAPPLAKPAATRPGFPGGVLGFGFSMDQAQAAQLCASKGQAWTLEGATGVCQSKVESAANPEVRLAFQLGVLSEIRTVYPGRAETMNRDYEALSASLRSSYGPPQVEPPPLSATCASSLVACLEAGEHPAGPVWHWSGGTIELSPSSTADRAALEIRYTREEPQAQ